MALSDPQDGRVQGWRPHWHCSGHTGASQGSPTSKADPPQVKRPYPREAGPVPSQLLSNARRLPSLSWSRGSLRLGVLGRGPCWPRLLHPFSGPRQQVFGFCPLLGGGRRSRLISPHQHPPCPGTLPGSPQPHPLPASVPTPHTAKPHHCPPPAPCARGAQVCHSARAQRRPVSQPIRRGDSPRPS